jgi:hypothetical protein
MFLPRVTIRVAAVVLALLPPVLGLGCGPRALEVDKAAAYTPESLAQELAFRYRALTPEAKKASTRAKSKSTKSIAQLENAEKLQIKAKDVATTKKRTGPPTLDSLLEEIDGKLKLINGTSRSEACQKAIETISKDTSLTESDKQLLTEKLRELAGAS